MSKDSFNTASGMDCMQLFDDEPTTRGKGFQYRKRYGLHAIQKGLVLLMNN